MKPAQPKNGVNQSRHARPLDPNPNRANSTQAVPKRDGGQGRSDRDFATPRAVPSRTRGRVQRRQHRGIRLNAPALDSFRTLPGKLAGFNWRQLLVGQWAPLVIGVAIAGLLGIVLIGIFSGRGGAAATTPTVNAVVVAPTAGPTSTITLNIQPWDGKGRFTMLLMGVDKRPSEPLSSSRTDVMMVLSFDPVTHTAGMLSIPRDLFVPIPGEADMQRINSAYEIGELKAAGTGPALAMQTIQYNFGLHVNSYVIFTFAAVTAVIDAVGGVDINVPSAINDDQFPDMNYGFDPLHIPAGMVHMDGTLALKYARTRHDDSDFERTHRQQDVMLAVRDKVVHLNMLPQLAQQAPMLWSQLQTSVFTDLTLDKMLSLAVYVRDIPPGSIHHATLEGQYVRPIQWQGDSVLTPDRDKLTALMTTIFGANYTH
jgi:LCP family protein required for cell wall assembly